MSTAVERVGKVSANENDSWPRIRLGDICEIVRGVSYKKEQASEQPGAGRVPILRATNIQNGALVLDSDLVYVPADVVSEGQMLRTGDIVVATSSGSKHLVGKTAQVKDAWAGSFGAFCATLRPKVEIDHRYLGYFFGSKEYKDYITKKALGVNINNLRRGDLEESLVPVAPLDQQKRIVAEIEKQLSRLDEAVANLKRVQANLKRYKAAVLKAAVEGRLVETEAGLARREGRSYETGEQLLQRILETRRSQWQGKGKYKEPAAPDTSNLPELPEGWVWATLDQSAQIISGLTKNPKREALPGRLPYLRVANVYANELRLDEIEHIGVAEGERDKLLLQRNDLLVVEGNGSPDQLGRVALWDGSIPNCVHQNHIIKVRFSDKLLPNLAMNWLLSPGGRHQIGQVSSSTSGLHTLSTDKVSRLPVPIPPLPEQHRIVAEVDRRLSLLRETEAQVDANLQRAERLREAILHAAFAGGMPGSELLNPGNAERMGSLASANTGASNFLLS